MRGTATIGLLVCAAAFAAAEEACGNNLFLNAENKCQKCRYTRCGTGEYRQACKAGATQDAQCTSCTNLPIGATWTSFGMPYTFDNCQWRCNEGSYIDMATDTCIACNTAECPAGEVRTACDINADTDSSCICAAGAYRDALSGECTQCTTEPCEDGRTRATCTGAETQNAQCV